ncbi:Uncharacterized protein Fot_10688 [Forsythia ovata]|uniref:Pentapeptide repeat-containing protein n=1 Tax=Forsythia ovata TaxID=205694 RepID=A0ABD1WK78_9LAMI
MVGVPTRHQVNEKWSSTLPETHAQRLICASRSAARKSGARTLDLYADPTSANLSTHDWSSGASLTGANLRARDWSSGASLTGANLCARDWSSGASLTGATDHHLSRRSSDVAELFLSVAHTESTVALRANLPHLGASSRCSLTHLSPHEGASSPLHAAHNMAMDSPLFSYRPSQNLRCV